MRIIALSIKDAETFLKTHERHYKAPVEPICAIGVGEPKPPLGSVAEGLTEDGIRAFTSNFVLHGAAILGRREDGDAELGHIYCDGASQAYSLLYGACWRALKALGYQRAVL